MAGSTPPRRRPAKSPAAPSPGEAGTAAGKDAGRDVGGEAGGHAGSQAGSQAVTPADPAGTGGPLLLTARAVFAICRGDGPAWRWFGAVRTDRLRLSVISEAELRSEIEWVDSVPERRELELRVSEIVAAVASDGAPLLAFDAAAARIWAASRLDPRVPDSVRQTTRMVYAVARAHGLAVVDVRPPAPAVCAALGVRVVDAGARAA